MPLTAEDHEQIRQLLGRYNFAIDLGDTEAWADCFTPDGVFECVGVPDDSPLGGRHQGREALVAYAITHFGINKGRVRHWNWNLVVDGADGSASMRCYMAILRAGVGPPAGLTATGIYEDHLVAGTDGWRFQSRRISVDQA
jgi:SnoaL-like domain